MKTNPSLNLILPIVLAALAAAPALAHEGTRGGGEVRKEADGSYVDRDSIDPTLYELISGTQMLEQNPTVTTILGSVARLNWYLAFALERDIRESTFVFTRFLRKVDTTDDPTCRKTREHGRVEIYEQAGIYTRDAIYVDRAIFAGMRADARARLILHEILHGWVAWDCEHNAHLRSTVLTLWKTHLGQITRAADLELALRTLKFYFPAYSAERQSERAYLTTALGTDEQARKTILASTNPDALLGARWLSVSLLNRDQKRLQEVQADPYGSVLAPFCRTEDLELVRFLVERPKPVSFDPAGICMSERVSATASDFDAYLLDHVRVEQSMDALLTRIAARKILSKEGRLMVSAQLAELTLTPTDSRAQRPIIELEAVRPDSWDRLPATVRSIAHLLGRIAASGDIERIARMTARDPRFYAAFSVVQAERDISQLPVAVPRERKMASETLRNVMGGFVRGLLGRLDKDAASKLSAEIDWKRLGYGAAR